MVPSPNILVDFSIWKPIRKKAESILTLPLSGKVIACLFFISSYLDHVAQKHSQSQLKYLENYPYIGQ
jgi:hypothetical protein